MSDEAYFYPVPEGRWAIRVRVGNRWVCLVQDSHLEDPTDAEATLRALGIPATADNLDIYFPLLDEHGRCPTLELLERCTVLDPTNPHHKRQRDEVGV